MATEVKVMHLQRELEALNRKLKDATDEKKKAICRQNKEWEQKFFIEKENHLKRLEIEKQEVYLTLETTIKLAKDKDIQQVIAEKDREMRKIREHMSYEKDNAIRVAKANSEEKYRTLFKQIQEDSRQRDTSLTKEIALLSKEKESLQERVSALRKTDLDKANTIKFLHYNHEKTIKEVNEAAKKDSAEEYKRYRSLEQYAHDKESEVNILNSKVLKLDNEREMVEKHLITVSKFGETHGGSFNPILAPRAISNKEVELARRVRELEKELLQRPTQQQERQLSIERVDSVDQTPRHASLDINSPYSPRRPTSDCTTISSGSPSSELEERLKKSKRQCHELRDLVLAREKQIQQLDQRIKEITHDLERALRSKDDVENQFVVERESYLMDHNKEMDELSMNNTELQDKLQECSGELIAVRKQMTELESHNTPAQSSNVEEEAVILHNQLSVLEKNYGRLQKDFVTTESLFSQWTVSDQSNTGDSTDKVVQLELEMNYLKDDLREAQEQVDAFQIRNEKLKLDYQKSRNDVDRLILQRESATVEKRKAEETEKEMRDAFTELSEQISRYSNLDKELKNQKEKYMKTKESLTSKIEHQHGEIERLRAFEIKALQVDSLKRELEHYKMNGNGKTASPPVSPAADGVIKSLHAEIISLRDELSIQSKLMKKKDLLIKQLDARNSPNPKTSVPVSIDLNSSIPKQHGRHSLSKISPTRHTSSSQFTSFDDSFPVNNNNNNSFIPQPNIHGSLTLPRPIKHRPKLQIAERSDEL